MERRGEEKIKKMAEGDELKKGRKEEGKKQRRNDMIQN